MAWGKQLADELAAQEAARVAQERAATTARMTPWEQQHLTVLGEIRDALITIATALAPVVINDYTGSSVPPQADSIRLAGGREPGSAPPGEHPDTT